MPRLDRIRTLSLDDCRRIQEGRPEQGPLTQPATDEISWCQMTAPRRGFGEDWRKRWARMLAPASVAPDGGPADPDRVQMDKPAPALLLEPEAFEGTG